jgi:hypothetical protein
MGLAAVALETNPIFPTYPDRMDPSDVSAGLVLPTAATALMGTGGAVASLLLIFMAVTSAMSAELIAVSSIFTYDIYQTYFNPKASGALLIKMSHSSVVAFAILMASFSTALHYIGISMGYLYLLMGVIISAAVLPAALTLMWRQQNWWAATLTPVLGLGCSMIAWLVTAKKESGELSVASTGANNPMLAGNVVALLSPLIFIPILTYALKPQNYDWQSMKEIKRGDDNDLAFTAGLDVEEIPGGHIDTSEEEAREQAMLMKAAKFARWLTLFLTIALLVLWPMPLYGTGYIFSKSFFTGWIAGKFSLSFPNRSSYMMLTHVSSRHSLALLLQLRGGHLPSLGRSPDHEAHLHRHLPGPDWQEGPPSSWYHHRGRGCRYSNREGDRDHQGCRAVSIPLESIVTHDLKQVWWFTLGVI